MSKADHSPGRHIAAYSNNAELDNFDEVEIQFEPVCPQNGWSMNEIWKYAYISPPPGYFLMEDSGPFRASYDYGEPAGYPSTADPHSTLPGDWTTDEEGQIVSFMPMSEGGSEVRKQTEKKKSEG